MSMFPVGPVVGGPKANDTTAASNNSILCVAVRRMFPAGPLPLVSVMISAGVGKVGGRIGVPEIAMRSATISTSGPCSPAEVKE